MTNIKDYREKELQWYIIANILILLLLQGTFDVDTATQESLEIIGLTLNLLGSAAISTIIFCLILVIENIFSSKTKDMLLYLGLFHLPGEKIFSDIFDSSQDKRFTSQQAKEKYIKVYSGLPTDRKEKYLYENSQWYSIYSKHRTATMIEVSNRDYLLCRDIYVTTIFLIVVYFILSLFLGAIAFHVKYLVYLFCMLIITNVGARQKAKRFAYNVIALDIQDKGEK